MMTRLMELELGALHRFADWPNREVPMLLPGVYTIWDCDRLIYVGTAGKGVAVAELNDAGQPVKMTRGLYGRLESHANGKRIGDPFSITVCDRFVVPSLSPHDLELVATGGLDLDALTKAHIRRHYEYRYIKTTTGMDASALANQIKRGKLEAGPPLINPDAFIEHERVWKLAASG